MKTFLIVFFKIIFHISNAVNVILTLPIIVVSLPLMAYDNIITKRIQYFIRLLIIQKKGKLSFLRRVKRFKALKRLEKQKSKKIKAKIDFMENMAYTILSMRSDGKDK